jgi:hypothetical protein
MIKCNIVYYRFVAWICVLVQQLKFLCIYLEDILPCTTYWQKNVKNIFLSICDVKVFLTFTFTEYGTFLTTILPILFLYLNTVIVTAIALVQKPVFQMKMTFQEIRIIATDPCIANQLWDVNTICRRSWYIASHVCKIIQ